MKRGIIIACVSLAICIMGVVIGHDIDKPKIEPTKAEIIAKLSIEDKRNIAIKFMAEYPSWKYTLCNMPMDGK